MISTHAIRSALALMFVVGLAACSGQKSTAQNMLVEIGATLSAAQPEAAKYIPEKLQDVQNQLAALQASADGKEYAAVVAKAPPVLAAAQSSATDAAAKKDEILKTQNDDWASLVMILPDQIMSLQTRLDCVNTQSARKRAKGGAAIRGTAAPVSAGALRADLSGNMTEINSMWSKAQAAYAGGNLPEAITTAGAVKAMADALATTVAGANRCP